MASPLAGITLRYLIAKDSDPGVADEMTLLGYDSTPVHLGLPGGYINVRQEEGGRKPGVDYIDPPDDIEREYGEPAFVFGTQAFWSNIGGQVAKWKQLGVKYHDIDNLDTYTAEQALEVLNYIYGYELFALLKNPNLIEGGLEGSDPLLQHAATVAMLVEHDADTTAQSLDALRKGAGVPDLPIRVVAYDDGEGGREWADQVVADAMRLKLKDFGVTYDGDGGEYGSVTHLLRPTMANAPVVPVSSAPWADTLITDTGKYHDGPDVPMLAQQIARAFPDDEALASYCAMAGQGTAWCGIYAGFKLSRYGLKPPRKDNGVGGFMYVDAWLPYGTGIAFADRKPGDLALWINSGGLHHISFVGPDINKYIGGNQSNSVTETSFPQPSHIRRPPAPENYVPQPEQMPMLMRESSGDAVRTLQTMLLKQGYPIGSDGVDGEFGEDTEAAVKSYQTAHGLEVDGIVGPETWDSLFEGSPVPEPKPPEQYLLTPQQIADITAMAASSAVARYSWKYADTGVVIGKAPLGATKGMAVMFAQCLRKLEANDSAVMAMTVPIGSTSKDALAYYTVTATGRNNVLRKLFVMMYGLQMCESSGNYTEGRDMSATNVTADTAEAGLLQQSWNSSNSSNEMKKLLPAYQNNKQPCYSNIFKEGITLKTTTSYGTGPGREYQELAKACPAFAVEMCGVGLRVLYNHWGPVVRQAVEMRAEADALLLQVEAYIKSQPVPEPEPEPEPIPVTDLGKARKRAMDSIGVAVDRLIADVVKITKDEQPVAQQQQSSGSTQLSLGSSIPPEWIDAGLRLAWPRISRMSVDEVIELKNKIMSGQFGMSDVIALVMGGGSGLGFSGHNMIDAQAEPIVVHEEPGDEPPKGGIMQSDSLWMNIRYLLIAIGVSMLVKFGGGLFTAESAEGIITPVVGFLIAGLTAWWGNYVRKGTATVPVAEAKRPDVETVSPATGKVEPGNVYR